MRAGALGILILHLLPLASRPALIGGDEPHYALMAHSIATDLDFDIRDDYSEVETGSNAAGRKRAGQALDRHLRVVNGREVFAHPLGLPLLVAPLIAAQELIAPDTPPDLLLGLTTASVTFLALIAMWRLMSGLLGDMRQAAIVVFGGYFASPLWFYSRTFMTEPYTWAFAILAIASITASRLALASLFLALTLAMKETAILIVLPVLMTSARFLGLRKAFLLALGPAGFALLFGVKNLLLVGTPFSTFQTFAFGDPARAAVGLLLDPTHGLAWFAPVLVAGMIGCFLEPRPDQKALYLGAVAAFLSYFAVTSAWIDWRGGSSYATRLLLPVVPTLLLPLARLTMPVVSRRVLTVIGLAYLAGFVVNWCAAIDPFTAFWGVSAPDLIEKNVWLALVGALVGSLLMYLLWARFPRAETV